VIKQGNQFKYEYWLKDHLGNVRVTFEDVNNNGLIGGANEIKSRNQYYTFGMEWNNRWELSDTISPSNRYRYNGKERWQEMNLSLSNYHNRLLDLELCRFTTIDKLSSHLNQVDKSGYAAFWNNPIKYNDPDGRCPICPIIYAIAVGFGIGAGADATVQIASNTLQGRPAFENYSVSSTLISGTFGSLSGGTGGIANTTLRTGLNLSLAATESVSKQVITDDAVTRSLSGDFSALKDNANNLSRSQVISDVVMDRIGSTVKAVGNDEIKAMERQLDRKSRIARNDPSSTGRATNRRNAQSRLNSANNTNNYLGSTSGNGLQNISDGVRNYITIGDNQNIHIELPNTIAQDNTRVNLVLPFNNN
jgi:RHS repeat-associated protein